MAAACPFPNLSRRVGQTFDLSAASLHPWLALVVRSRHEKSVKTILDSKGYRTAVPLVRCIHKRRSGSAWDSQKPLIAGYVFAGLDRENPFRLVTTPGVVQIVSFGNEPGTIPEAEIEALERIAASGLPVAGCGYTRIGEAVELIDGPLKGVQGIVLRQAKTTRLVVGLELLQRSVTVEIDGAWAVPIRYIRPV
jgi:transcription antitermination factor NusG